MVIYLQDILSSKFMNLKMGRFRSFDANFLKQTEGFRAFQLQSYKTSISRPNSLNEITFYLKFGLVWPILLFFIFSPETAAILYIIYSYCEPRYVWYAAVLMFPWKLKTYWKLSNENNEKYIVNDRNYRRF